MIYKGNYPWLEDIDRTFLEIIMFLIIIIAIGSIIILTLNIVKHQSPDNKNESRKKF